MKLTIYHNPRCSKSRKTLELLQKQQAEIEVIEYLKTPPDHMALKKILSKLVIKPEQLLRKGEAVYKELGLSQKLDNAEALIDAMVENPMLIERPIVINGNKATIGRPPESVLAIL